MGSGGQGRPWSRRRLCLDCAGFRRPRAIAVSRCGVTRGYGFGVEGAEPRWCPRPAKQFEEVDDIVRREARPSHGAPY
jgi:hypothetical protein